MTDLLHAITTWRAIRHINKAEELEEAARTAPTSERSKTGNRLTRAEKHLHAALDLAGDNSTLRDEVRKMAFYLARTSYALPNEQQAFIDVACAATSQPGELESYCAREFHELAGDRYTDTGIQWSINNMQNLIGDNPSQRRKLLIDLTKLAAGETSYPAAPHLFPGILAAASDPHEAAVLVTLSPDIPTKMLQSPDAITNPYANLFSRHTNFMITWHHTFAQAGNDPVCQQAANTIARTVIDHLAKSDHHVDGAGVAAAMDKNLLGTACNIARRDPAFRAQMATLCVDALPLVAPVSPSQAMTLLHVANALCQRPLSAMSELSARDLRIGPDLPEYGRLFVQPREPGQLTAYATREMPAYKDIAVTAAFGTPSTAEFLLIEEIRKAHRFNNTPPANTLRDSWVALCTNSGKADARLLDDMQAQPQPAWVRRHQTAQTSPTCE